jgi:hypothetical protein
MTPCDLIKRCTPVFTKMSMLNFKSVTQYLKTKIYFMVSQKRRVALPSNTKEQVASRIGECKSMKELLDLYFKYPQHQSSLRSRFTDQKVRIMVTEEVRRQLNHL